MPYPILTEVAASISELKANPMKVVASGDGMPIAVLNRNEPAFYCVPAQAYEALMDLIDDAQLLKIVKERMNEESIKVFVGKRDKNEVYDIAMSRIEKDP